MGKSLQYKDDRATKYDTEFSDSNFNKEPVKLTNVKQVTRDDGDYTYDQLDIKSLIKILEDHDRTIRQLKQCVASLNGQMEYIYKNGVSGYVSKIDEIRTEYPKPT